MLLRGLFLVKCLYIAKGQEVGLVDVLWDYVFKCNLNYFAGVHVFQNLWTSATFWFNWKDDDLWTFKKNTAGSSIATSIFFTLRKKGHGWQNELFCRTCKLIYILHRRMSRLCQSVFKFLILKWYKFIKMPFFLVLSCGHVLACFGTTIALQYCNLWKVGTIFLSEGFCILLPHLL